MMSSKLKLGKRRLTFVRLLGDIQHALNQALQEEHKNRGLTRAEIARKIGCDKSFVTRKLNGTSNMTLETLADLAFALDRPVRVTLPERSIQPGANYSPDLIDPAMQAQSFIAQQQTVSAQGSISAVLGIPCPAAPMPDATKEPTPDQGIIVGVSQGPIASRGPQTQAAAGRLWAQ